MYARDLWGTLIQQLAQLLKQHRYLGGRIVTLSMLWGQVQEHSYWAFPLAKLKQPINNVQEQFLRAVPGCHLSKPWQEG
ncbi:hypothetical protein DPM19_28370 [Actinomadura craniellae]|uniref:Uncharacterized protein n=1 Tax=Actinomadura craniellae TaxID=2231787 RepID=A0A365GYH0_9ACTN|nr:hypothetical protein DPM19_28370 [Actinomadura craniellae]